MFVCLCVNCLHGQMYFSYYRSEYVFNFDSAFELHNDIDVLKRMGLDCGLHAGNCTAEDLRIAKSMLPKGFESTVDGMLLLLMSLFIPYSSVSLFIISILSLCNHVVLVFFPSCFTYSSAIPFLSVGLTSLSFHLPNTCKIIVYCLMAAV